MWIYSDDKEMESGKEKCAMFIRKSNKWQMSEGMEIRNQEKVRTLGENETFMYLGILKAGTIKQAEMKDKIKNNISGDRENF